MRGERYARRVWCASKLGSGGKGKEEGEEGDVNVNYGPDSVAWHGVITMRVGARGGIESNAKASMTRHEARSKRHDFKPGDVDTGTSTEGGRDECARGRCCRNLGTMRGGERERESNAQ